MPPQTLPMDVRTVLKAFQKASSAAACGEDPALVFGESSHSAILAGQTEGAEDIEDELWATTRALLFLLWEDPTTKTNAGTTAHKLKQRQGPGTPRSAAGQTAA